MRVKFKMQWRPQRVTDDRNEECLLKKVSGSEKT